MKLSFSTFSKPLFFSWILVLVTLSLVIKSCLYSDDIFNYQMIKSAGHMPIGQLVHSTCQDMIGWIGSGRFTPLSVILEHFIIWLSSTILIYKIILFIANLLAVYMFTRLLRALEMGEWIPFSLLLFCAVAQFYIDYHDAFTTFQTMFQVLAILIFSSISTFISFLKSGKAYLLFLSLLTTALAILDYEIGFIIYPILLILLIADSRSRYRKILFFAPFLLLLIVYALIFTWVRIHAHSFYGGVDTYFDICQMAAVVFFQLVATIPLTGFAYLSNIFGFLGREAVAMAPVLLLSAFAFYFLWISERNKIYATPVSTKRKTILMIGLTLWIFPAFILMVSKKYQAQASFGKGYLPVYIQNFGLILLVVVLCSSFFHQKKLIKNLIFIFFFFVFIVSFLKNDYFINSINTNRSIPSCFYYKSLKNGILDQCEDHSVIVLGTDYYYHAPFFYQVVIDNFYNKKMQVIAESDFNGIDLSDNRAFYKLEHNAQQQFTVLYKLQSNGKKELKRYKYPTGEDFSYFDLISKPL